jgi:prepilin-type N-terminal cleavage/methylation domain-containing protein
MKVMLVRNAKRNNEGYTLVEILVVVALIGIALGVITMSLATLFSANAKKTAYNMSAMIAQARVNAMYKSAPVFVRFYIDGDSIMGQYYEAGLPKTVAEVMGSDRVVVEFVTTDGTTVAFDGTPGKEIYIGFDRLSGRLRAASDFASVSYTGGVSAIDLSSSASAIYEVSINPVTGKHEVGGR